MNPYLKLTLVLGRWFIPIMLKCLIFVVHILDLKDKFLIEKFILIFIEPQDASF